ncbi:MAG: VCBS repeat-containing protein [Myxococcota bacterium]
MHTTFRANTVLLLSLLAVHACGPCGQVTTGGEEETPDARVTLDASVVDAARPDAAPVTDAASAVDVGAPDATMPTDASAPGDAAVGTDAGTFDAAVSSDAGSADAATSLVIGQRREPVRIRVHVVADDVFGGLVRGWNSFTQGVQQAVQAVGQAVHDAVETVHNWVSPHESPPTDDNGYAEMEVYDEGPVILTAGDGTFNEEASDSDTTLASSQEGPLRDGTLSTWVEPTPDQEVYITPASTIAAAATTNVVSPNGGTIIGNNGSGIVGNNGGGLAWTPQVVGNNGGSIIGNNGGSFRRYVGSGASVDVLDSDDNTTTLNSCNPHLTYLYLEWGVEEPDGYSACPTSLPVCSLVDADSAGTLDPADPCTRLGLLHAAFSQLAVNLGLANQMELIDALKRDFADGRFDGKTIGPDGLLADVYLPTGVMLTGDVATTQLANAARDFLNSSYNLSGLTAADFTDMLARMETTETRLADSELPFVEALETTVPMPLGCAPLRYTLRQPGGRRVDIQVEYDDGSGFFQPATRAGVDPRVTYLGTRGAGTRRLTTGVTVGEPHVFWWNSTKDVPNAENAANPITVRVSAFLDGRLSPHSRTVQMTFNRSPGNACNEVHGGVFTLPDFTAPRIAVGDVNGDGALDLVTVSGNTPGQIGVMWGLGTGEFYFQPFATEPNPIALAVGDYDGDGLSDVVVGAIPSPGESNVVVYRSTGDGLEEVDNRTTWAGLTDVALGDITGDGNLDIVASCRTANKVIFYTGIGNGQFSVEWWMATDANAVDLALGDVTGDFRPDVVVAHGDGPVDIFNVPEDTLTRTTTNLVGFDRLAFIDIDRNGRHDLLSASNSQLTSTSVDVLTPELTFDRGSAYPFLTEVPVAVAPINSEGGAVPDYVVATLSGEVHRIYSSETEDLSFSSGSPFIVDPQVRDVVTGDFDSDGLLDVAVSHGTGRITSLHNTGFSFSLE